MNIIRYRKSATPELVSTREFDSMEQAIVFALKLNTRLNWDITLDNRAFNANEGQMLLESIEEATAQREQSEADFEEMIKEHQLENDNYDGDF